MGKDDKLYHDVDVSQRLDIAPSGKAVPLYHVSAVTKSGVYFTVKLSEADFSKEAVAKALTEKATLIESIKEG